MLGKRSVTAVVGAVALVGVSGSAASADYRSANCTAGGLTAGVGVYYVSSSSGAWKVLSTVYALAPADTSSDQNNVTHVLFGGTTSKNLRTTYFGVRDGQRHTLFDTRKVASEYFALKNHGAYVRESVVFDKFGSDPRCSKNVYLP